MTPGFHSDGFIIGICCAGRDVRREGKAGGREAWIAILCDEPPPTREYLYTHRNSVTRNDSPPFLPAQSQFWASSKAVEIPLNWAKHLSAAWNVANAMSAFQSLNHTYTFVLLCVRCHKEETASGSFLGAVRMSGCQPSCSWRGFVGGEILFYGQGLHLTASRYLPDLYSPHHCPQWHSVQCWHLSSESYL